MKKGLLYASRLTFISLSVCFYSLSHVALAESRSIDGSGNNVANPSWGEANTELERLVPSEYGDGSSSLGGSSRPGPRELSNVLSHQNGVINNESERSDFVWVWGQFLDHDIDLTPGAPTEEIAHIPVPFGDEFFDPESTGTVIIPFTRSIYSASIPRQQLNLITSYIDASNVYGSDPARAAALRDVGGKLKVTPTENGDLLPYNTEGLDNAGDGPTFFLAGDVRANEQSLLTVMHTIFVREHNRLVDELQAKNPGLTDDELYEEAKATVEATMQAITYNEFLPHLLGENAMPAYSGYDSGVNAGIANIFSTSAYRLHSLIGEQLHRIDEDGDEYDGGHLSLAGAFFQPSLMEEAGHMEAMLRGAAAKYAQKMDTKLVSALRNFLFGPPGAGGLDLAALNLQRGRDHGLGNYNAARVAYGLPAVTDFEDITSDAEVQGKLADMYDSVDDIDVWMGAAAEDHVEGSMVGELVQAILADQFIRLRDGDRFWYEHRFSDDPERIAKINNTTLSDVIARNTSLGYLQDNVFKVYHRQGGTNGRNTLFGTSESDLLIGFNGRDMLIGMNGDDALEGGRGRDGLFGGRGDDSLDGGPGRNYLHGGQGSDQFKVALLLDEVNESEVAAEGNTRIVDYTTNDALIFTGGVVDNLEALDDVTRFRFRSGELRIRFDGGGAVRLVGGRFNGINNFSDLIAEGYEVIVK